MNDSRNCWDCGKSIDAQDFYCRYCGQGQGDCVAWYYHPVWIGILTVLGLGPFSLFLIWKTPKLSTMGRLIEAALVLAFTVWIVHSFMVSLAMLKTALAGSF